MHDATDMDLLRQYADRNSDAAFAALVSRHVDLVYSAALRFPGNSHHAEEITQAVFVILARKAGGSMITAVGVPMEPGKWRVCVDFSPDGTTNIWDGLTNVFTAKSSWLSGDR